MKVHMVNQNKPKLPRNHSGFGPWLIIAVILSIGIGAMLASSVKAEPMQDCSVTGVTTDNLMSEDRAAYMACCEHGEEFTIYDME
jgi:hypothetical protein